jgi:DUF4097 and DUF4098 domain-containing protein YvlB
MATYPPVPPQTPPPPYPPPGFDPRAQREYLRAQARAQRDAFRAQRMQMRYRMRGLRRGSVLGPILLIVIGVFFLMIQTGRLNHDRFWGWYGHWWPLLLLLAGVVLLAEWGLDQILLRDPERPRFRRSVGAGVSLLLVFAAIAGVLASKGISLHHPPDTLVLHGFEFTPDSLDELFGDKHESDQAIDLVLPTGGSLAVVNPRGDITVSGTSDDNRIHVAVHKQIYSRSDSDADSRAQEFSPAVTTDGDAISVVMHPLDGARADITLTVPAAAAVTVTANRGNIQVSAIKAPVTATSNHGDMNLSAITGPAIAHINSPGSSLSAHSLDSGITIQGHAQDITLADITGSVSVSGEYFGTVHFEHIAGPIKFHTSRTDFQLARLDGEAEINPGSDISADQAMGPFVLTTNNRNIALDRVAGDISVTDRNGSIDLTAAAPLGNISLQDRNGSIKTIMPERAGFVVQAGTTNGDIDSDLELTPWGTGSDKSISGTVGAGGPRLSMTTSNGDLSIHKADVAPLPAAAPAPARLTLVPAPPAPSHTAKAAHSKAVAAPPPGAP